MFNKTKKLIASAFSGFLATAGKGNKDAGVKVGNEVHCSDVSGSLLGQAFAEGYREDLLACEKKLEAAADALRQIECELNDYKDNKFHGKIHKIAQDAWRAATSLQTKIS
jgi:hypothetical protein